MGIITPVWYFAPQRREIAEIGWKTLGKFYGVLTGENISGLDNPAKATMLLQLAGEFCDSSTKKRLWDVAEEFIEPTWNQELGEFTLGLRLNEPHPRGQWNARIMAGWVCEKGDWSKIFNEPNLRKFSEPTLEGVNFPDFALSEARWTGDEMHLRVQPKTEQLRSVKTSMKLTNIKSCKGWVVIHSNGEKNRLLEKDDHVELILRADNEKVILRNEKNRY